MAPTAGRRARRVTRIVVAALLVVAAWVLAIDGPGGGVPLAVAATAGAILWVRAGAAADEVGAPGAAPVADEARPARRTALVLAGVALVASVAVAVASFLTEWGPGILLGSLAVWASIDALVLVRWPTASKGSGYGMLWQALSPGSTRLERRQRRRDRRRRV